MVLEHVAPAERPLDFLQAGAPNRQVEGTEIVLVDGAGHGQLPEGLYSGRGTPYQDAVIVNGPIGRHRRGRARKIPWDLRERCRKASLIVLACLKDLGLAHRIVQWGGHSDVFL